MEGLTILALVVTIPVIIFPAAFVWYLTIGGLVHAGREARAAREKQVATVTRV
jgi:hypothetical protein